MRPIKEGKAMAGDFEGEVIRDARGREVVRFTTGSGLQAIVATCIPPAALAKLARKLERKIARRQARLAAASGNPSSSSLSVSDST